jgi:serpin B
VNRAQAAPVAELVAGNTAFALDLYAELRQVADGNLLFSPFSVSQALAMTSAGAAGETAAQMKKVLAFSLEPPALHEAFGALNTDLVARGTGEAVPSAGQVARALRVANALWGEQTYPFSETFSAELERFYGAGLQQTDFLNAPEDARVEINTWVEEQTEDRIQDIVPERAITSMTRLVLANAIYFYGAWLTPFSPDSTSDEPFYLLDGTSVTAPFMFLHHHFEYTRGNGYQAIELPYAGDGSDASGFAFMVILPDEGQFEAFETGLDAVSLDATIGTLEYTEVRVWLPRFEFEFGSSLAQTLQSMGMTDAFDARRADFSGMVEGTPPEPLFIGDVLHKAFIGVDENGTEAAAATVVMIGAGAAPPQQEPPKVRIDRPFLFAIRDSETGTLLFLGRVMDPTV